MSAENPENNAEVGEPAPATRRKRTPKETPEVNPEAATEDNPLGTPEKFGKFTFLIRK